VFRSGWITSSFRTPLAGWGLEAKRVGRGNYVLFQEPGNMSVGGPIKVSLARWSRFIAAIKTGRFEPQREHGSVTVCIGDLSDDGIVSRRSFIETTEDSYSAFTKGVLSGDFDHL
jgi:hypothetical protein